MADGLVGGTPMSIKSFIFLIWKEKIEKKGPLLWLMCVDYCAGCLGVRPASILINEQLFVMIRRGPTTAQSVGPGPRPHPKHWANTHATQTHGQWLYCRGTKGPIVNEIVSAAGAPARFFSNFKSFEMPTLYRLNSQKVRQLFFI
jgi:hypothetical protein